LHLRGPDLRAIPGQVIGIRTRRAGVIPKRRIIRPQIDITARGRLIGHIMGQKIFAGGHL
jgi:hypothetical protein